MVGTEEFDEIQPAPEKVFRIEQESIDATNAWTLRPALLEALGKQPDAQLWLDLSRVHFIDSTGLGMLVGLLKEARERNGGIYLINANREVRRLLQVTGLEAIFDQPVAPAAAADD